jgi:hypothetical protein
LLNEFAQTCCHRHLQGGGRRGGCGAAAWVLSTLLPLPPGSKWACAKAGQKAEGTPPLLPSYRNES